MTYTEQLPPLPEPAYVVLDIPLFSSIQMMAYAQAALARVPLTDEQIDDCMPMGMAPYVTLCGPIEIRQFARAIEAACGITAKEAP